MEADDCQVTTFHNPTVIPSSAFEKPSIMKRYHRRRTCSHTSPRRSSSANGGMTAGLWKLSALDGHRPSWYLPLVVGSVPTSLLLALLFYSSSSQAVLVLIAVGYRGETRMLRNMNQWTNQHHCRQLNTYPVQTSTAAGCMFYTAIFISVPFLRKPRWLRRLPFQPPYSRPWIWQTIGSNLFDWISGCASMNGIHVFPTFNRMVRRCL